MRRGRLPVMALLGLWCLHATTGHAQDVATRVTPAISEPVYAALAKAQRLVSAGDPEAARVLLDRLREGRRLTPYEIAQSWNYTAYIELQREAYASAIAAYQEVLEQGELPEALRQGTLKTLAQLHFTVGEYARAIERMQAFEGVGGLLDPDLHMLLGQAHYELAEFAAALPHVEKAVAMSRASGEPPAENRLLLLQAIHHQREDLERLEAVSLELATSYPRPRHLRTLAGVYSRRGDTRKLLSIMETLYDRQALTGEAELRNLANLYLLHGMPYKAAVTLEKEMAAGNVKEDTRNLRLLSQAWYSARDDKKAIPPLVKAAKMGEDAELYMRLAQSYLNLEMWAEAAQAAKDGLAAGDLKRKDTANIMYGMALFNQKKLEQARRAFQAAGQDNRSKRAADQWIKYVDSEILRRDTLEQKLPDLQPRDVDEILRANAEALEEDNG